MIRWHFPLHEIKHCAKLKMFETDIPVMSVLHDMKQQLGSYVVIPEKAVRVSPNEQGHKFRMAIRVTIGKLREIWIDELKKSNRRKKRARRHQR